jgi:hypothetical protein
MSRHPWVIVSILIAGLAAWMGLGTLHDFGHADSLLPVLVSTQRWTPFFWGQDRFGMLVPLLAMPIRQPLANLLVQGWITTSAGLLAPFVVARFATGRGEDWIAIGACTNLLFLLITPPVVQFDWLVAQPYGLSICLGFAALVVAGESDRARDSVAALLLLGLACWINIGIVVMLAIGAIVRGSRPARLLALEAGGTAFALLLARYFASVHTVAAILPPRQWLNGWTRLLQNSSGVIASPVLAGVVAVGTTAAVGWLWKTGGPLPWRQTAVALAMGLGTWLVSGTSLWIGMNSYVFRYMYPALMAVGIGVSIVLTAPFARRAKTLAMGAMIALAGVATVRYGTPSLGRVAGGIDARFGGQTAAVVRSGATVIAGDYWRVWPAVFHVNLVLSRTHSHARVFGLAYRSEETDALWKVAGRRVLIAASPGDASVGPIADEHGIAVTLLEHFPTIDLYTGQP